jgi:alkylated DNA repair dioxygenase AlkB
MAMEIFEQLSFLNAVNSYQRLAPVSVNIPDATVILFEQFFSLKDSDRILSILNQETHWRQDYIHLFDKTMPLPRLTAWYGDSGKHYIYSGINMYPEPWTATLLEIKAKVEAATATCFNSVLLNKYRTGKDSVAWHSDNEPELGHNPAIASVSFGATRRFVLKHKFDKSMDRVSIDLPHGSLLLMRGSTQHFWLHQIPKTAKQVEARINLTFRFVV